MLFALGLSRAGFVFMIETVDGHETWVSGVPEIDTILGYHSTLSIELCVIYCQQVSRLRYLTHLLWAPSFFLIHIRSLRSQVCLFQHRTGGFSPFIVTSERRLLGRKKQP